MSMGIVVVIACALALGLLASFTVAAKILVNQATKRGR